MTEMTMSKSVVNKIIKGDMEYIVTSEFGNQRLDDLLSGYVADKIVQSENIEKVA